MVAQARCEHHLRVVARRAVAAQRIVADQVGAPLHSAGIHVHEQGRVSSHDDDVAVAFQARHERGIAERGAEVRRR